MSLRTLLLAGPLLILSASARDADAGIIALFDFNDASNGVTSGANTAALFSVDAGSGSLSSNFAPSNITAFNGTTVNAQAGDPAGQALALQNGTNGVNNGAYLQFNGSTVGNTNIMASFAIQRTATGFNSDQFQYSVDGVNFVNFGAPFVPIASFTDPTSVVSVDFSSIAAVNNDANFAFRIIFSGGTATSSSGNNRIDNLTVVGTPRAGVVPEPASIALLGLGLVGAAAGLPRRRS